MGVGKNWWWFLSTCMVVGVCVGGELSSTCVSVGVIVGLDGWAWV